MWPTRHRSHSGPLAIGSHSQVPVSWSHDPTLPKGWHLHTETHTISLKVSVTLILSACWNHHIHTSRSSFVENDSRTNKVIWSPWQPVGSSCLRLKKPCLQRSQRWPSTFSLHTHWPLRASHWPPPREPAGSQLHAETHHHYMYDIIIPKLLRHFTQCKFISKGPDQNNIIN